MTKTVDIITTGTTNANETKETKTKPSFAKRLCDSLYRDTEMRAVSEDPDNAYLDNMEHILDLLDDECDTLIKRAIYFSLHLDSMDAICGAAVVALRERYLAGYRAWPNTDVAVALAYAEVLTDEIDVRIANDYLAYMPMSDIQDTLDSVAWLSAEANAAYESGDGPERDRLENEMVSLIQSILREEIDDVNEDAVRNMVFEYEHDHTTLPADAQEVVRDYEYKCLPVDVWKDNETIDDTNERLDDLLKIGHLTVDDLIKGIPHADDVDPINVAAALVSGGLVCDPDGHVHVDPFVPTSAINDYPRRIVNALLDCRLEVVTKALDILSFDASTRTVELTPDVFATILAFAEVPEEVWMPHVEAWRDDPWGDRYVRHSKRYQAVLDAYDTMYDDYRAAQPCADIADDNTVIDDDEFDDAEYDGVVLDEYLIATGGWLLVEDNFDQRFFVNCLDVYGFDDARTIADAGSVWPSATYQAIRAKHRAA